MCRSRGRIQQLYPTEYDRRILSLTTSNSNNMCLISLADEQRSFAVILAFMTIETDTVDDGDWRPARNASRHTRYSETNTCAAYRD